MKLAVFLPNWIGDVVMATPMLRALRRHFPAAEMVGVQRPYVGDVLAGTEWLDRTIEWNPRATDAQQRGWGVVRQLRREAIDCAVLLPNSMRTALVARAGGARRRIGYARPVRRWLLTDALDEPSLAGRRIPVSALDQYLQLAYALGCDEEPRRVELATTTADRQAADRELARLGVAGDTSFVALNTGGAFGAAKRWPNASFAELARRLAREAGETVLVVCGPAERADAREIARQAGDPRVVSLSEAELSIGLSKECVRRARLLVTTDSGPRHFAAALGTSVVTLFGPTHIAWSENYHDRATHLQKDLPCVPCQQRTCPLGHHQCMTELSVNEVFTAALSHLEQLPQTHAA